MPSKRARARYLSWAIQPKAVALLHPAIAYLEHAVEIVNLVTGVLAKG